jgi:linoleoyl-CoA desaturase
MPFLLRFSPSIKRHWLHRYQFAYVWIFYCLSTISWITSKDFIRIKRYKKMGFLDKKNEYQKEISILILSKFLYYCFVLILPLIIVPLPFWLILLAFFSMHLMTGFLISTVFQIAHIMPGMAFPEPDENGLIAGDWSLHQMATTTNFSPKSRFFSWLIGGLNYQVEHHLLPNICHIHYRELSPIVATTAREYGMPYHTEKTFRGALWGHIKMLHHLGKKEELKF